jgi:hypothetical protein
MLSPVEGNVTNYLACLLQNIKAMKDQEKTKEPDNSRQRGASTVKGTGTHLEPLQGVPLIIPTALPVNGTNAVCDQKPSLILAIPEPEHGQSEMQYFSMSPELSLILACLMATSRGRL